MITGSQASAYYGEPRFTRDIDIVADIKPEQAKDFVTYFPGSHGNLGSYPEKANRKGLSLLCNL